MSSEDRLLHHAAQLEFSLLAALETDPPHSTRKHLMAAIDELNALVAASAAIVAAIPAKVAAEVAAAEVALEPVIAELKGNIDQATSALAVADASAPASAAAEAPAAGEPKDEDAPAAHTDDDPFGQPASA